MRLAQGTGTRLGSYEIVAPLGAGGMGEVYRARDTKLNREVALKVLPEAFASDAQRMARFQREAQVLASLNHTHIAAIYGLEESGGVRALVMELVEGPTLAERISGGSVGAGLALPTGKGTPRGAPTTVAMPPDEALLVAKQIAEALEYAHEKSVIHRDLKPANVKLTPEGQVKVLDFGLAKALEVEAPGPSSVSNSPTLSAAATQAGVILGTAAYMSPEQARGKTVDRRADIWAFGCVLYEMLTGRRAFEGESATDTLAAVIKSEPNWDALPRNIPANIRRLLERCLDKDPKHRLQAIGEARIAIEETLSGDTEPPAPAVGAVREPPLQEHLGRRALPWALAGLLAGALASGVAVWRLAARASQSASMHFSAITNFAGVQAQPALSPDGRSVAFVSDRDGHYNIYVGLISGGSLVQITHDPNLVSRPCWSPDGTKLAYARLNDSGIWDIWEIPALGGAPRRLILDAIDPAWSPDGHLLAYENMATGTIWISDPSGQNARQVTPAESLGAEDTEPRFSPNGRELAFVVRLGGPYGELAVADLDSGKVRQSTNDNALALSPAWSPDGRFIYFASSRGGTLNIWKIAAGGGEPDQITAGQGDDAELDVSSDGKRIVFSTFRENINIAQLDLATKPVEQNLKPLTTDPARNQIAPVFSPDGKHLAYFSNRKGAEKESIWVANADGSDPVQLVQDSHVNVFPRWTPNGEHLVYRSRATTFATWVADYRRVPISGGAPQTVLKNVADLNFDVGPDGRLLFRGSEGKIETYDPSNHNARHSPRQREVVALAMVSRWALDSLHREPEPGKRSECRTLGG